MEKNHRVSEDEPDGASGRSVSRKLLEVLVCPASGGRLDYDAEAQELISRAAGRAYPIRAGIPIMLIDEARELDG
ncbi:MAG: Trm112 family protein [Paracoccaceae bacterium]